MIKVEMTKHSLDYRKFYAVIPLESKKVTGEIARKLSETTGMKWRPCGRSGHTNNFQFETMIITNRKKRREMKGQIIEIE